MIVEPTRRCQNYFREGTWRTLVSGTFLANQYGLRSFLTEAGVDEFKGNFRDAGEFSTVGNIYHFCMAESGIVVLESADKNVRLATTLPESHLILVDPVTILKDNPAAARPMPEPHQSSEPRFIAYIIDPSRTAEFPA
jgi:L-lactate dehydrogenase complex protein LldG